MKQLLDVWVCSLPLFDACFIHYKPHSWSFFIISRIYLTTLFLPFLPSYVQRVLTEAQGYLQQGRKKGPDDSDDDDDEAKEEEKKAQGEAGEGEDEVTKQARRKRAEKIVAALSGGDEGSKDEEDDD